MAKNYIDDCEELARRLKNAISLIRIIQDQVEDYEAIIEIEKAISELEAPLQEGK